MTLTSGARYLVDTNILVYSVDRASPFHIAARTLLEDGVERGTPFVIAHQNVLEFIAVLTSGHRVPISEATNDAESFIAHMECIAPLPTTWETCANLLRTAKRRPYIFDCYLTATMLDHGIHRIITQNKKDFEGLGLEEIRSLSEQ